jgi:protein SCO1/2
MKSQLFFLVSLWAGAISLLAAAEIPGPVSANPSLSVIAPAPAFLLKDTSGKAVHLSDYRGQVVLLAFIFTSCPAVCPLISQQMSVLQESLKRENLFGSKAHLVSVTVDPKTDTAQVLADYARTYNADSAGWHFLRETPERTKPVLRAYDEWTRLLPKGELDHPARVYLVDRKGDIREIYSLAFFSEKQALIDMQKLLITSP